MRHSPESALHTLMATAPGQRCAMLLVLLLGLLTWPASHADHQHAALVIAAGQDHHAVAQAALYLEDPQGKLTISDIAQPAQAARFRPAMQPSSGADINFGYSSSAWWLALPLQLAKNATSQWLLEIGYPSLDHVEVYVPQQTGEFSRLTAGDLQRFAERPYPHRNLVFPLTLVPGATQTVYLRVISAGNLTIPMQLWRPETLVNNDRKSYALLSLYYGMLLALGLYNLLLFLTIRDPAFLAYVAFTAAMAVGQASMNGFGNQFAWPDWPAWGNVALPSGMAATGFFGALFTRLFLRTRQRSPKLDRTVLGCAAAFAFAAVSPLFMPYQWCAILVSLLGITFSAVAVAGGIHCLIHGHPGARYFLLAWTLLLLGVAVLAMRNLGWLPTTGLTLHAMQIGSALELLLLSFALADRINVMQREKDRAHAKALQVEHQMVEALRDSEQKLEKRVAERTLILETLNNRLREKEKELEHLVRHDPLTGLANRLLLNDRIEHAVARARRSGTCVALLMIDLDGFKQINDTKGHAVGDELLMIIAQRLRECIRETDTAARLGGDEFIVLLEDTCHPEGTHPIIEKLIAAVRRPVPLNSGTVEITASIGMACAPQHALDAEQLLERADAAMYAAKAAGRNCWSIAPDIISR